MHDRPDGVILGGKVVDLLAAGGDDAWAVVRLVNCLAGCKNPCNVALAGNGKPRLRFSRLGPGDGENVIEAAKIYGRSAHGELTADELPAALRDRLSARSPTGAQ
jgi:predicted metal-binding protein